MSRRLVAGRSLAKKPAEGDRYGLYRTFDDQATRSATREPATSGQPDRVRTIKYIGSKRRLLPEIADVFVRSGATTALDLFTGTTQVAQVFKKLGAHVTTCDTARYSEVLASCHIGTDAATVDHERLTEALRYLNDLPGEPGYFTETFCENARYFQPFNGARIDAIRNTIATEFAGDPLHDLLLSSLIYAADRVDSTCGTQTAYLKSWSKRSANQLRLETPRLLAGSGTVVRGDAVGLAGGFGPIDFAYLDPPYNSHSYYGYYHVWETLVAWDAPEHYGITCRRADVKDPANKSPFNSKASIGPALAGVIADLRARVVVLSYNDESWLTLDELLAMFDRFEHAEPIAFETPRYIGAHIGIHSPQGVKVGKVSHTRNTEYLIVAGDRRSVRELVAPYRATPITPTSGGSPV